MKTKSIVAGFVALAPLFVLMTPRTFGFSRVGHETIAELAYRSKDLSRTAKDAIDLILATQDLKDPGIKGSIRDAAEWPDEIKSPNGAYHNNPFAKEFIKEHPDHHKWHYVNFPVGSTGYDPKNKTYAISTDIVHSVQGCIAVLEGTGEFDQLKKIDALRFLLHLVGDAHQPLHTIAGYFDISDAEHPKLYDASKPIPAKAWNDTGGNNLFYQGTNELHAAWDDLIVNSIAGRDTGKLEAVLENSIDVKSHRTTGDYHDWIKSWVSDSMIAAAAAYKGLNFGQYGAIGESDGEGQKRKYVGIVTTLPAGYVNDEKSVEKDQISKGATHLLQLLNAIQWAK